MNWPELDNSRANLRLGFVAVLKNTRWEKFAQLVASGESGRHSLRLAGYKSGGSNSHKFTTNPVIAARIRELKEETATSCRVTRQMAEEVLSAIALNKNEPGGNRIQALRTLGSWCGWETGTEAERLQADSLAGLVRRHTARGS